MSRKAKILRKTKETNISVEVNLDGKGKYQIKTKIGFLDHMLEQLAKHSLIDMKINAKGSVTLNIADRYCRCMESLFCIKMLFNCFKY